MERYLNVLLTSVLITLIVYLFIAKVDAALIFDYWASEKYSVKLSNIVCSSESENYTVACSGELAYKEPEKIYATCNVRFLKNLFNAPTCMESNIPLPIIRDGK
jgi:hypothetical protein